MCDVLHTRALANLPMEKGFVLGMVEKKDTSEWERIVVEATRAIPGRENVEIATLKILAVVESILFYLY